LLSLICTAWRNSNGQTKTGGSDSDRQYSKKIWQVI
jgi:hypothetical protein